MILYEGPSRWDRKPVVMIATGYNKPSANAKTGPMIQTYILRQDMNPADAVATGHDDTICGNCKHRGVQQADGTFKDRTCYVLYFKAPKTIWRHYKNGGYQRATPTELGRLAEAQNQGVRFGAYGDPAMVPLRVWQPIVRRAPHVTSYTHQWLGLPRAESWAQFTMASVDNLIEKRMANALGYRTFRVVSSLDQLTPDEIECVNTSHGVPCADCQLCGGLTRPAKNIAIVAHGFGAKKFRRLEQAGVV